MKVRRLFRSDWNLRPRRASSPGRPLPRFSVIGTIFEDRDLDRNALNLFVTKRKQLLFGVGERLCDIAGYHAGDVMGFCRFLHSCGDIDRAAVNADRPLGVALLAHDDLAAMHPDPKTRDDTELPGSSRVTEANTASSARRIRLPLIASLQFHNAIRPSPLYR